MRDQIACYCINLDERPEKWKETKQEAKKLDLQPERFSGIKFTPEYINSLPDDHHFRKVPVGHNGCRESHRKLLSEAKDEGVFMIIEDDILVVCEEPINVLDKAIGQLPDDWDMLYLGATLNEPLERYSENLYRIDKAWATHAVIYNNQNGVVDFILDNQQLKFSAFLASVVQGKFNCFITYPMICTQRPGFSDIVNKEVSYKVIEMRYKKYTQGYWCDNCHDATKEGCEECEEDAWWLYV